MEDARGGRLGRDEFCQTLCSAGAGRRGQRSDGRAGKNPHHGLLRLNPNRVRGAMRLSGTGPAGDEANVEKDDAIDGLDDFAHGCGCAARRNVETT